MGAIIGVLVAIGYLITPLGLKELPVPKDEVNVGMLDSLKIVLSSIPFRYFVGFNLMKEYVFLILGAMLPFWRKYVLGITGPAMVFGTKMGAGDQEAILLGVPFILMIPLLLIWQRIVPRLGSRMSWMVGNALFLPGLIIMTLANNFYTGLLGTALIAPGLAVYQLLPLPMISEIIDDDGSKHGYRREGIFMGMSSGIVRAAFSLQGVLLGTVFSISGYVNGAAVQSISAIWGIRFLIGITPIISIVISYLLLWKFPFGRERVTNKPVAAVDSVG